MEIKKFFENTDIELKNNDIEVNRNQVQNLYEANKATLRRQINKLKEDGLIRGVKNAPKSGKSIEVYNLDETISIGFRLRSKIAIKFQRWARSILSDKLKQQQRELDYFWDKSDQKDLYR